MMDIPTSHLPGDVPVRPKDTETPDTVDSVERTRGNTMSGANESIATSPSTLEIVAVPSNEPGTLPPSDQASPSLATFEPPSHPGNVLFGLNNNTETSPDPPPVYSVQRFCGGLVNNPRAADAKVQANTNNLYLRVERRKDPAISLLLFGVQGLTTHHADDTITVSGRLEHLYDSPNDIEATMSFPSESPPAPLIATALILCAIATESQGYELTRKNCWFFTSIIQDILLRVFGARYVDNGSLNQPNLEKKCRASIFARVYRVLRKEIDRRSNAVLAVVGLIGDPTLTNTINPCLDVLKYTHERTYTNRRLNFARVNEGVQELLITLYRKLHEHLHACGGIQGARVLSDPAGLVGHLRRLLPTSSCQPTPSGDDLKNIIRAVSNAAMSANAAPPGSPYTYQAIQHELPSSPTSPPLHVQQLALFAMELLPDCKKALGELPEAAKWGFQLNHDIIPELQAEFERQISPQLRFMCGRWIDLLFEAGCTDDEVTKVLSPRIPALRHWVAAMSIMGEMDQVCRSLKALHVWLDAKNVVVLRQKIYDLYRWVVHSRGALSVSSLSIIGKTHPFIPSCSPLRQVFGGNMANGCWIVMGHVGNNQAWPSRILEIGLTSRPHHAVFSPDGCRLAVASGDHTVHLRDATTGSLLRGLEGHTSKVLAVAFSPDGRHLASASADRTVRTWDAANGVPLRVLKGHNGEVNFIVFSPDSRHLASASSDCSVRVWDTETWTPLRKLRRRADWMSCVAFSPDGRYLASASDEYAVHLWDAAVWEYIGGLEGHTDSVCSVAFSSDGRLLASASSDHTIRVWDVKTRNLSCVLTGHVGWVESIAFSPDGRRLASASHDHTVRLWDATMGTLLQELRGHTRLVESVAFSPDGRHLASASHDKTVRTWSVATDGPLQRLIEHTGAISSIAFSLDGCHLASTDNNTVQVWDVVNGCSVVKREQRDLPPHHEISFSADGSVLRVENTLHSHPPTVYLCSHNLERIGAPCLPLPSRFHPRRSPSVYLEQNSLCITRQDVTLHVCWLPDYFEPTTPVAQHENHVCVGGKEGMVAFVDLNQLGIPDN